jgi:uncharacterized protein YhfF
MSAAAIPIETSQPPLAPEVAAFWDEFLQSGVSSPSATPFETFYFDDNAESANHLGALVLAGVKRATTGLLWSYVFERAPLPQPGDLSIVTDFAGQPLCVIEMSAVEIVPFADVDAAFAAVEGEGDGSLAYWRRVHEAFFERECARIGRTPDPRMPVVCQRFQVIFRRPET